MKGLKTKLIAVACAATMIAASAAPAVAATPAPTYTINKTATVDTTSGTGYANAAVNVRSGAGKNYKVLVTLKVKDVVRIIGNKNGWLYVVATHNNKAYKGYMGASYVTLTNGTTTKTTVTFTKLMNSIYNIQPGSSGASLRTETAIKKLKKYASGLEGKTTVSSFTVLAKKWLKKQDSPKAAKAAIKEAIEEMYDTMGDDGADVLYSKILNGITLAC